MIKLFFFIKPHQAWSIGSLHVLRSYFFLLVFCVNTTTHSISHFKTEYKSYSSTELASVFLLLSKKICEDLSRKVLSAKKEWWWFTFLSIVWQFEEHISLRVKIFVLFHLHQWSRVVHRLQASSPLICCKLVKEKIFHVAPLICWNFFFYVMSVALVCVCHRFYA